MVFFRTCMIIPSLMAHKYMAIKSFFHFKSDLTACIKPFFCSFGNFTGINHGIFWFWNVNFIIVVKVRQISCSHHSDIDLIGIHMNKLDFIINNCNDSVGCFAVSECNDLSCCKNITVWISIRFRFLFTYTGSTGISQYFFNGSGSNLWNENMLIISIKIEIH